MRLDIYREEQPIENARFDDRGSTIKSLYKRSKKGGREPSMEWMVEMKRNANSINQRDGKELTQPKSLGDVWREDEMEQRDILLSFLFDGRRGFFDVLLQLV